MQCYRNRNDRLSELGITYQQYLATDEWKAIRKSVLMNSPPCLLCSSKASQVHHTDYEWETLLGLRTAALAPLCDGCHSGIEFDGKRKRTLAQANTALISSLQTSSTSFGLAWLRNYQTMCQKRVGVDARAEANRKKREASLKKKLKDETRRRWKERKGLIATPAK